MRRITAAAVGVAAYAFIEPYRFKLREVTIPAPLGAPGLTLLHVSDLHLRKTNRRLKGFLDEVPDLIDKTPDLVLATGDLLEDDTGIDPVVESLNRLDARLGRFYVPGSHDYFQAHRPSYLKYWRKDGSKGLTKRADTARLEKGLQAKGWISLTNRSEVIETDAGPVRLAGVDDPHLKWHDTSHLGRLDGEVYAIGLMHAPDLVSDFALRGFDLILAGHTHGGQVRVPGVGAVVTNSALPAALAKGMSRVGGAWLHVSPGLGTSVFSPIRFGSRPEITLIRLSPQLS